MRLMFLHSIDRYRVIEKIIKKARLTYPNNNGCRVSQQSLASKIGISHATINRLEHLARSADNPKCAVSRRELIKIVTTGLNLRQEDADTILWLYDGLVLTMDEIYDYVIGYIPAASHGIYSYEELMSNTIRLLRESMAVYEAQCASVTQVENIVTTDVHTLIYSIKMILEVEKIKGHATLVSKHPPFLIRDAGWLKIYRVKDISGQVRDKIVRLHEERQKVFMDYMRVYGYRSIHQRSCVERYLCNDYPYAGIPISERQAHIRQWIGILKSCPNYEVGLVDTASDMEIFNKGLVATMVRATPFQIYPDCEENPFSGLRFIKWSDEVSAFRFFLECNDIWEGIPIKDRTKDNVISFLENLLEPAKR